MDDKIDITFDEHGALRIILKLSSSSPTLLIVVVVVTLDDKQMNT